MFVQEIYLVLPTNLGHTLSKLGNGKDNEKYNANIMECVINLLR